MAIEVEIKLKIRDRQALAAKLTELGFRPGPAFSEALGFAHKLQLAGVEQEEALSQTKGFLKNHPLLGEGGPGAARDGCGGDT